MISEIEPMELIKTNKNFYISGHSLEAIYISNGLWIESRSWVNSYHKNICRWKFTDDSLTNKIKKYISKNIIEKLKDGLVLVAPDIIIELPPMGGKVSDMKVQNSELIYYVLNPDIIEI